MKNNEDKPSIRDEIRGQAKKNMHHIIKLLIAIILIPTLTIFLDTHVLMGKIPVTMTMMASVWATYILISLYDGIIKRETQRAKSQIQKNTLDIIIIKEDIKHLQRKVYKEEKDIVRAKNMVTAMKRKGEGLKKDGNL